MKVAIIGAGSHFTGGYINDMILCGNFEDCHVSLMDIDGRKLDMMADWVNIIVKHSGSRMTVGKTMDLREALEGADFVVISILIGGYGDLLKADVSIPLKYGIAHTKADTVGPGMLSRTLRTVPHIMEIARAMERYCPDAWMLNLANPMSALTYAVLKYTPVKTLGLCHNTRIFAQNIMRKHFNDDYTAPCMNEYEISAFGINHFSFIEEMKVKGKSIFEWLNDKDFREFMDKTYPLTMKTYDRIGRMAPSHENHICEFLPYYNSDEFIMNTDKAPYCQGLRNIDGFIEKRAEFEDKVTGVMRGEKAYEPITWLSSEEGFFIMSALAGKGDAQANVNLINDGFIPNLPSGCICEATSFIKQDGVVPMQSKAGIPRELRGFYLQYIEEIELAVEAAVTRSRRTALQALLCNPRVGFHDRAEDLLNEIMALNKDIMTPMQ
ncbi:MAG: hypothetical protein PHT33_12640 [bacterium]|nr:hypothetical protein [bacterium]